MIGQKILLVLHLSIIQRGILAMMTALMDGNEKSETHLYKNLAPSFVLPPLKGTAGLAWIIHEGLLRQPMLSPGGAFLVRSPRRTASTSASASLVRSPWERARLGAPGVGGEMEASVSARTRPPHHSASANVTRVIPGVAHLATTFMKNAGYRLIGDGMPL